MATFEDTQKGDLVSITIHNGDNKMTMESHIINIVDNCLVVEPFLVEGAILNFPPNMDIEMMVVHPESTPLYWQKVNIVIKLYHEQNCHVIMSKLPGVKLNRRNNFRVFVGSNCKMTGATKEPINVTLKDISNSGFAVLVNKDVEIDLHKKISVEYTDNSFQKFFELSGRPIRKAEINNQTLYGCILDRKYPDLEGYLTQKQMEKRPNRKKETDNKADTEPKEAKKQKF